MEKVLLVEDSKEVFAQVKLALGNEVSLDWVETLSSARDFVSEKEVHLILLDVELPDGNGVDLCNEFQSEYPQLPIFFLSAHSELPELIMGFSAGADDYIAKPFSSLELKARVLAKLKKVKLLQESQSNHEWKPLKVYRNRQEVFVDCDGVDKKVELTALEFKILSYFCDHVGVVIPRDQMLNEIWGENIHIYPRSVDTHVSKLRKKLGDASSTIKSVHGVGYRFEPEAKQ